MELISTVIKGNSIELTYSDSYDINEAQSLIILRMPVDLDPQKMLKSLREEALLKARNELDAQIRTLSHILDPAR